MNVRIDFEKGTYLKSWGGNKVAYQSAIVFTKEPNYDKKDVITIEAVNPRTNVITTGIAIQFPVEKIDEIIHALNQLK